MSRTVTAAALARNVWRRAALPVVGIWVGLGTAHLVTATIPPRYEATATIMVTADERATPNLSTAQSITPTIARMVGSREVWLDIATTLRLPEQQVAGRLSGRIEPGVQLVTVVATAPTAQRAADLANAAGDAVGRQLARLRLSGDATLTLRPFDKAAPPARPQYPIPPLNSAVGALIGLLAGVGAVVLRDRFDSRLRDPAELPARLGLPVLGVLPRLPRRFARHHAEALYQRPDVADAVGESIAAVSVLGAPLPQRRLLVTSAHDEDGRVLVASLLAVGLADQRCRVTLVDGAVREPALASHFPDSTLSWQQVLAGTGVAEPLDGGSLTVLPTEPRPGPAPSSLAGIGSLLGSLGDQDTVIVHAPPVLAGRDFATLARHADGVILVVQVGRTRAAHAGQAARLIHQLGLPLAGIVAVGAATDTGGWRLAPGGPVAAGPLPPATRPAEPPMPHPPVPVERSAPTGRHHRHEPADAPVPAGTAHRLPPTVGSAPALRRRSGPSAVYGRPRVAERTEPHHCWPAADGGRLAGSPLASVPDGHTGRHLQPLDGSR